MKSTPAALLLIAALLTGCAPTPVREIPVRVPGPKTPEVPDALKGRSASTGPSISERMERLIQERDDSLTKARR